jgi:hypothetical protein
VSFSSISFEFVLQQSEVGGFEQLRELLLKPSLQLLGGTIEGSVEVSLDLTVHTAPDLRQLLAHCQLQAGERIAQLLLALFEVERHHLFADSEDGVADLWGHCRNLTTEPHAQAFSAEVGPDSKVAGDHEHDEDEGHGDADDRLHPAIPALTLSVSTVTPVSPLDLLLRNFGHRISPFRLRVRPG